MYHRFRSTARTSVLALLLTLACALVSTVHAGPREVAREAFELRLAGQVEQAVQCLEAGLETHPEAGILYHELARTRLYLLQIGRMIEAADAAVRCEPNNSDFRYFAAMADVYGVIDAAHHQDEARMKQLGEACLDQLEATLARDPEYHRARCLLVEMSVNLAPEIGREVAGTEDHVRLLEAKDPVLGARARAHLVGDEQAAGVWHKLMADYPDDCAALAAAAEGLILAGELDEAEDVLDRAIAKNPTHCYGLLRLGLAHVMQGDVDGALALTDRYLAFDPPLALKAFAIGRKGVIYRRNGDPERGRALVEKARRLDPDVWLTVMPPPEEIFMPL